MPREVFTKSEQLFEELCRVQGVPCTRLAALRDRKQPDYELVLTGLPAVAEVKQIEPNDDDARFADALRERTTATQSRDPDAIAQRVRNHIDKSRLQFRSYLGRYPQTPTLLILFDSASNGYTDSYTIQTALHGYERVAIQLATGVQGPTVVDRGFPQRNNRALRQDRNEHLSALATLHECWELEGSHERFLALQVYHNPFATTPLNPTAWSHQRVRHYRISDKVPGRFQNWQRIDGKANGA